MSALPSSSSPTSTAVASRSRSGGGRRPRSDRFCSYRGGPGRATPAATEGVRPQHVVRFACPASAGAEHYGSTRPETSAAISSGAAVRAAADRDAVVAPSIVVAQKAGTTSAGARRPGRRRSQRSAGDCHPLRRTAADRLRRTRDVETCFPWLDVEVGLPGPTAAEAGAHHATAPSRHPPRRSPDLGAWRQDATPCSSAFLRAPPGVRERGQRPDAGSAFASTREVAEPTFISSRSSRSPGLAAARPRAEALRTTRVAAASTTSLRPVRCGPTRPSARAATPT